MSQDKQLQVVIAPFVHLNKWIRTLLSRDEFQVRNYTL